MPYDNRNHNRNREESKDGAFERTYFKGRDRKTGNVLKVDSFLNHQMDIPFINELGRSLNGSLQTLRSIRF